MSKKEEVMLTFVETENHWRLDEALEKLLILDPSVDDLHEVLYFVDDQQFLEKVIDEILKRCSSNEEYVRIIPYVDDGDTVECLVNQILDNSPDKSVLQALLVACTDDANEREIPNEHRILCDQVRIALAKLN